MISQRTWTIGTAPDCDLRVESPTVSARHCRLTRRGQSFFVEDLSSTNGTFVAGEPVHQPRAVRPGESIMLGQSTPMPWPDLSAVSIGRLSDNDFVVPLDNVSSHHARLERQGGRVYLVDLGSRNGTALNDPMNKISRAEVKPGDIVFLGTHRLDANDLLACLHSGVDARSPAPQRTQFEGSSPLPAAASDMRSKGFSRNSEAQPRGRADPLETARSSSASVAAWAIGAGLAGACAIGVAFVAWNTRPQNGQRAEGAGPVQSKPMQTADPPTAPPMPSKPREPSAPPRLPSAPSPDLIRDSVKGVYVVCLRVGNTIQFTEATAWAISPDKVICPSVLLGELDNLRRKDGKLNVVICSPERELCILEHASCAGDTLLSVGRLDGAGDTVAIDRQAAAAFEPVPGQKLAVIVARGASVQDQADCRDNITTQVVTLTVDRIVRDAQNLPVELDCVSTEDIGRAVTAPVFDGSGFAVGCVNLTKKRQVRVVPLRHLKVL